MEAPETGVCNLPPGEDTDIARSGWSSDVRYDAAAGNADGNGQVDAGVSDPGGSGARHGAAHVEHLSSCFYMQNHFFEVGWQGYVQHGRTNINEPGGEKLGAVIQHWMTIVIPGNWFQCDPPSVTERSVRIVSHSS